MADEECEHDWEYIFIVNMGQEHGRWAYVCIECDEEDDSEPYYGREDAWS